MLLPDQPCIQNTRCNFVTKTGLHTVQMEAVQLAENVHSPVPYAPSSPDRGLRYITDLVSYGRAV